MGEKLVNYGGQAIIEGVLMRGKRAFATAMRSPDGSIVLKSGLLGGIYKSNITKIPFLRGLILLWDSLGLGMSVLTDSANLQSGQDEKLEGWAMITTISLTILAAIAIFFLAPAGVGWLTERYLQWNPWWSNLVEGCIRLIFFMGYIWGIGFIPEIRRVFAYHGAEHKTINAYEAGVELSPGAVAKFSVEHPRCGTAFLLTLMVLSLFFFTILGPLPLSWRLISRVVMIPVLTGIAYEYLRWTSNNIHFKVVQWLIKPSLALQHLTTREPDEGMLEVAISAFQMMRKAEQVS